MENKKTLILIDGHALAFRQFYALERSNMKTSDGTPTWAVYGFFKAIFDLLKNRNLHPDAVCVAFDVSHKTFRVEKYSEYKANRQAMPDNMQSQMELIYEGLKAFNIPVYTKEGYEADDVIGTISKHACELGHRVLILTGDQDAFQLVDKDGCVKVIIPTKGELKEYDWQGVYEKFGVYPDQIVDYKSLSGDSSDNIPGVKGIGDKTAINLLKEYGHLKNILENINNIKQNKVRENLIAGREMAEISYYLATIVRDVDIDFDFSGTKIVLPDLTAVTAFLTKLQFHGFLKSIDSILAAFNRESMQLGLFSDAVKAEINKVTFDCDAKIITDFEDFADLIKALKSQTLFAFRTEGELSEAVIGKLFGIEVAYCDNYSYSDKIVIKDEFKDCFKSYYIPIGHYIDSKISEEEILKELKPIFEDKNIKKITHDVKTERNLLRTKGIITDGFVFDTLLASYVHDPGRTHDLNVQSVENISHIMDDSISYIKNGKTNINITNLSLKSALNFTSDVLATIFTLTKYWLGKLNEKEYKLLSEIELPLSVVLADMEYDGVSVDRIYLEDLSKQMADTIRSVEFQIYKIAGEAFNISSPKQVSEMLFNKLQLKTKKKHTKTKYSTGAEVLEELAQEHEIAKLILLFRKFSKLKSTYTDALSGLINPVDGRIHTTYNQTVAVTGRLSSSGPNLQNIPVRTEEGNKIRKAFVPADRKNYVIYSADYSQIELRILAHVCRDENLIEAFKSGEDVHSITASKVFDVPLSEVTKVMRYKAKAVNFGIVYGQSKYGLAKALGITAQEAESFMDKYFATYPNVKLYMQSMVEFALEHGYVETVFGRKRYLASELNSTNGTIREFAKRAAINQPMQGTAADLIKMAMVDLKRKMKELKLQSKLIIQVHDELVIEAKKDELDILNKIVKESMELNQPLLVPLVIDINTGETWQE